METNVKDRLMLFIKSQGVSVNKFEKMCGFSTGYVANMRKSLQPDKLMSIVQNFPLLNTGWLMTGEGQMLNDNEGSSSTQQSNNTEEFTSLKQAIQTQSVAIRALNKAVELQEGELKRKEIDLKRKEDEILRLKAEIQRLQRANQEIEAK